MVQKARILENQKKTKEKENPRPSPQHNRLSRPQSLLPMRQTVHGVEIMASMIGIGMKTLTHGGHVCPTKVLDVNQCPTHVIL